MGSTCDWTRLVFVGRGDLLSRPGELTDPAVIDIEKVNDAETIAA
jgi:hypothetical protein